MVADQIRAMSAPKLLETQEHWEKLLGHLLEKAQRRHEELTSVQDNRWEPGDRCEDALLGGTKMNGAVMALDLVLRIELELDARMDAAQRVNEQDDPACD